MGGGGGGEEGEGIYIIIIYTKARAILGDQNLEFQYFWGFSEK